jgi:hypothetical protein
VVNLRYFPRLAAGQDDNPAVNERVTSIMDNAKITDVWDGECKLSRPFAEGEETFDLQPVRVGAGFRGAMSYTVTDLKTPVDNTHQSRPGRVVVTLPSLVRGERFARGSAPVV